MTHCRAGLALPKGCRGLLKRSGWERKCPAMREVCGHRGPHPLWRGRAETLSPSYLAGHGLLQQRLDSFAEELDQPPGLTCRDRREAFQVLPRLCSEGCLIWEAFLPLPKRPNRPHPWAPTLYTPIRPFFCCVQWLVMRLFLTQVHSGNPAPSQPHSSPLPLSLSSSPTARPCPPVSSASSHHRTFAHAVHSA